LGEGLKYVIFIIKSLSSAIWLFIYNYINISQREKVSSGECDLHISGTVGGTTFQYDVSVKYYPINDGIFFIALRK